MRRHTNRYSGPADGVHRHFWPAHFVTVARWSNRTVRPSRSVDRLFVLISRPPEIPEKKNIYLAALTRLSPLSAARYNPYISHGDVDRFPRVSVRELRP